MDMGEAYIKMCEKAEEIQKEWEPTGGDFYSTGWNLLTIEFVVFYESLGELITGRGNKQIKKDVVWLPRQDQLQKMILNHGHQGYSNGGILVGLSIFSDEHNLNEKSMGQLWLAFVMKEKFGKVWNGEEWITEKSDG